MYPYGAAPHVAPSKPKKPKRYGLIVLLVAFGLTGTGVATYVFLMRLSDTVLAILATIMVAVAAGAPTSILALFVLARKANGNGNSRSAPQPSQMTPPIMMMTPPMAWPQMQQQPQQPQATWEQASPVGRRYTVVGEEGEW